MNRFFGVRTVYTAVFTVLLSISLPHAAAENVQTASATVATPYRFIGETVRKAPKDKAEYRAVALANGMTVLLISDPAANQSIMAAALPIGSKDDPITQQGMAHYLEHMIFMGSKHYPDVDGLMTFLQKNGGRTNASTNFMRTSYHFQVNHDAFDEAVARMADALAFPILSPEYSKKELNAVNAELVRAKASDAALLASIGANTVNPAHPSAKSLHGSRESLRDKSGSKLHDELLKFHRQYYSANLFKAVLYSRQPIEQLAKLAADTLGKMPNKQVIEPKINVPLYREQDKAIVLQYKPLRPEKSITLTFGYPKNEEQLFRAKTGAYLAYLLTNTTAGTLSDYLIKNGLSDSGLLALPADNNGGNESAFVLTLVLTEKGWQQRDRIISMIFQQIELIKQSGIDDAYYQEIRESLKQSFQTTDVPKSAGYAAALAETMLRYPLANIIDAGFVADGLDKAAVMEKLNGMTPDNMRLMEVSDGLNPSQHTTPYFGAVYDIRPFTTQQKAQWLDFSGNPKLVLPQRNPYFADDFSANAQGVKRSHPKALRNQKGLKIFHMPSQHFGDNPEVTITMMFSIMPNQPDLKLGVAALAFGYMNDLTQSQLSYQSKIAGMSVGITPTETGFVLNSGGYAQHLGKLTTDYLRNFTQTPLNADQLEQARKRLLDGLKARKKAGSLAQTVSAFHDFERYPTFDWDDLYTGAKEVNLQDVAMVRNRILSNINGLRVFSFGNFSDKQAKSLVRYVQKIVPNANLDVYRIRYPDVGQSERKLNHIVNVPHEDNALSIIYMPKDYEWLEGRVRASLLTRILSRWYFDDLRTDKQLGYSISQGVYTIGKTAGLQFSVQSADATPAEIMRHNQRFFEESWQKLQDLSEEDVVRQRNNMLIHLRRKPESLLQEAWRYANDFLYGNYEFDTRQKIIDLTEKLTKQDLLDFYRKAVMEREGFVFASQALGTKAKESDAARFEGYERVTSIAKLQKEFEIKEY
ncbi:pitrilysin [Neisseria weixii]|uniref:Protease 3 n=1 Tax=Neisseria weixii TaxID=1853276 RepID=A0A3N4NQN9_9NEIS|nr:pitrilysin [Neisseria weixii]RPD89563.1 pitrilysin [Neisseria weixii]RPD89900.1 pitrilysin [Neisseria weixii]